MQQDARSGTILVSNVENLANPLTKALERQEKVKHCVFGYECWLLIFLISQVDLCCTRHSKLTANDCFQKYTDGFTLWETGFKVTDTKLS